MYCFFCIGEPLKIKYDIAGGSTLADLQQSLEDYLPVLLGLVKDGILVSDPTFLKILGESFRFSNLIVLGSGSELQRKVTFVWINQEDDAEVCVQTSNIVLIRSVDG